ncbi:hypothetical protein E6C70_03145 [Glaciibacter flavus]|uniref:HdeD family acid-resistance protein n=1 Tax=Orlajensenia flava TaxID=2565934 RepID=A0A4S4FVX9_9MICO|nr:DUF308 domain-containing protein [Glaciibacter flavus]THG35080.1 hypothetical protein E6C70_03145 [Glaciibacter flavus]
MSSASPFSAYSLDAKSLTKSTVNTVRVALGLSGVVALLIGILIVFWPNKAAAAITVLLAIYLLIAGLAYVGIGIFAKGISGGARAIDIILGVLFVVGAIVAFANIATAAATLAILIGLLVGIAWIIEGVVTLVQVGDAPSRAWAIFFAIISIIAGITLLFSPLWGAVLLFVLAGIALIVLGIVQIVRAFTFGRGVTA